MKPISTGHVYELANFEKPELPGQVISFIKKEKREAEEGQSTEMVTIHDGTTNEEVLEMLIDRTVYLNSLFPCEENERAIRAMNEALVAFNERTANRKARNVEGKHEA